MEAPLQIEKILNNNVVIILDENDQEVILMGRGLGFKRKIGDEISESQVEKINELKSVKETEKIEELFAEISDDEIYLADKILTTARIALDKPLNDVAFIAIVDHLHSAIERFKQGIAMKNFLLWDIKRFFPKEFAVGKQALDIIDDRLSIRLPEDEAGFLTLHLVNAEMDIGKEDQSAVELTRLIEEILTVVKYTLKINFDEDTIYFQRFMTHLKFFSERVLQGKPQQIEENVDDDLYYLIVKKYPEAFEATKKITSFLEKQWHYSTSPDEQVYLTIHLARIIDKSNHK